MMSAMRVFVLMNIAILAKGARSNDQAGSQFMQGDAKQSMLGLKDIPAHLFKNDDDKKAPAAAPEPEPEKKKEYDGPKAEYTSATMPKVSPALQCVINLSIQYFVVYTLLAFMRTFVQFTGSSLLGMQKILETACTTVTYAPMLAVLFLGIRMRAIQLTQGQTE